MSGTIFCMFSPLPFSALRNCSEFSSQNCSDALAKRQQGGDYDERVVAESKPVGNLVSRSCAGPSTTPSSTVSSIPVKFGSNDHEMRLESRAGKPSSNDPQENLIKRDRVTESRSRATTGSPMTRKPNQTENLKACPGNLNLLFKVGILALTWRLYTHSQRQRDRETQRQGDRQTDRQK